MDVTKLKKLKEIAADTSILYVEDSLTLQKQISQFLGNIFDRFLQAYDGSHGVEIYKEEMPDIVITDITMPNKNGLEMIQEMKAINPDVKVIVLSAHNNNEILFNSLDLGIISYLLKPLSIDKLIDLLIEDIELIEKTQHTQSLKDLRTINDHNVTLTFLNTYQGLPQVEKGTIEKFSNDSVVVKTSLRQTFVMDYEKFTIIELPETKRCIKLKVESSDAKRGLAILSKPRYINYKARRTEYIRVKVDNSFTVKLFHKNKHYNAYAYDVSFVSLRVVLEETEAEFYIDEELDISFGFNFLLKDVGGSIIEDKFYKIFAPAKIIKVQNTPGGTILVFILDIKKADASTFEKYLSQIENKITLDLENALINFKKGS